MQVLSASYPAERRLSASKPRGLACRRTGSLGRPTRRHPAASGDIGHPLDTAEVTFGKEPVSKHTMKDLIPTERIEPAIVLVRGHKVILDGDLARIYGVPTK